MNEDEALLLLAASASLCAVVAATMAIESDEESEEQEEQNSLESEYGDENNQSVEDHDQPAEKEEEIDEIRENISPFRSPTPSSDDDDDDEDSDSDGEPTASKLLKMSEELPKRFQKILKEPKHKPRQVNTEKYYSREPIYTIEQYKQSLGINDEAFDKLYTAIRPMIQRKNTLMREAIRADEKLAASLKYLINGEHFVEISKYSNLSPAYLAQAVPEVCQAIYEKFKDQYLKLPSTKEDWANIAEEFNAKWQYPFCMGAIDTKHMTILMPKTEREQYLNSVGLTTVILFGLVDANGRFLYVDSGCPGSLSDDEVIRQTDLWQMLLRPQEYFPEPNLDSTTGQQLPYVFVAKNTFPLMENLMTLYPEFDSIQEWQQTFNCRLSLARQASERAFEILTNRFKILSRPIKTRRDRVPLMLQVCCLLHNFFLEHNNSWYVNFSPAVDTDPTFMEIMEVTEQVTGQRISKGADEIRTNFASVFMTDTEFL